MTNSYPTLYLHGLLFVPLVPVAVQYFSFVQQGHRWHIFPVFVFHMLEQLHESIG